MPKCKLPKFNPSMRIQNLRKIINEIKITWNFHYTHKCRSHKGRLAKSWTLHVIFHLKNSKWRDTHMYFSDLQYDMEDLKRIEYEFQKMKEFFDEVEKP